MFKTVAFHGSLNNKTGYGFHAQNFVRELSKLIPVNVNGEGEVNISLLDTVSASQVMDRKPFPSILYNVWESTEQPAAFMERLKLYDQLWVASEWQRACSISQGVPEEFVKVVPEGVNPDIFKSLDTPNVEYFNFLHIGQWQPRKSTLEICRAFIKAFPADDNVRLYLGAETHFPSDEHHSTAERLTAYSLNDPRIIPLGFEQHLNDASLLKLFAKTHCFVSCSRSEGWGMPMCFSMACGLPTIVADFGGSTEYAENALKVKVPAKKKPQGIYGGWDVPGEWGEPDYDHLVEVMQDAYSNYDIHKKQASVESIRIRNDFSWEAAAKKAYVILEELSNKTAMVSATPEAEIRLYARQRGYEVGELKQRKAIFAVDCWPSSQDKMDTLIETIKQIQGFGYPVLVTSHYALPAPVIELADFYIYEKQDIMSGEDKPIYWRRKLDGTTETAQCNNEYQGVAALNCFRNAIDFCRGKYDWIYQMGSDMEVDLERWLSLVHTSDRPMVCIPYEGVKNGIGGGLWAGRTETLHNVIPHLTSWKQYADLYPDVRFVAERWIYNYVASKCDIDKTIDWIDIETTNRFDNVDRDVWKDDEFQCNFIDGAYLNIIGISNREYDVTYSTPVNASVYGLKQKVGMWSKPSTKYFTEWTIVAKLDGEIKFEHTMNLEGKRVLISMGSKALGDTIAWMPYVEEFRKKYKCYVLCSGWWMQIFDYPEIEFVMPGSEVRDIYASYTVGCFDNQLDKNVVNWRQTPLQKVAADILNIDYTPIRAKLKGGNFIKENETPYICFSEFSTMQNKLWNRPGAWQMVIDYLNTLGYNCISISAEKSELKNVINHNGQSIEQTIVDIAGAEFYVGLNHGPVWLAYALSIPAIMITGVSEVWNDFDNPWRISVDSCIPGCFNDPSIPIDRNWTWCPRGKDYACTRDITPEMVIERIDALHLELNPVMEMGYAGQRI